MLTRYHSASHYWALIEVQQPRALLTKCDSVSPTRYRKFQFAPFSSPLREDFPSAWLTCFAPSTGSLTVLQDVLVPIHAFEWRDYAIRSDHRQLADDSTLRDNSPHGHPHHRFNSRIANCYRFFLDFGPAAASEKVLPPRMAILVPRRVDRPRPRTARYEARDFPLAPD